MNTKRICLALIITGLLATALAQTKIGASKAQDAPREVFFERAAGLVVDPISESTENNGSSCWDAGPRAVSFSVDSASDAPF